MRHQKSSDIIALADEFGEFVKKSDGFVYYLPSINSRWHGAYKLHVIAAELDRRNRDWERQLERMEIPDVLEWELYTVEYREGKRSLLFTAVSEIGTFSIRQHDDFTCLLDVPGMIGMMPFKSPWAARLYAEENLENRT